MALGIKHKWKEIKDTGYGNNADNVGTRLLNKDGGANSIKTGVPFFDSISWFHTLLKMNWLHFIFLLFCLFVVANILFTAIYFVAGIQHLNGIVATNTADDLSKVFFFSVQTFTTVGYGHISPNGFAVSAISSIEAFSGLLFFALATGLLYGRFANPKAYIKFSTVALIGPYENGKGLMIRLVTYKNNHLTEAEVKLSLAINKVVDGKRKTEFFQLPTEISKINSLVLSWTIVHPINEDSPLYGFTNDDITTHQIELLVFIRAFDESFSNTVTSRTSYLYTEFVYGAKFLPMFHRNKNKTEIEVDKLSDYTAVAL